MYLVSAAHLFESVLHFIWVPLVEFIVVCKCTQAKCIQTKCLVFHIKPNHHSVRCEYSYTFQTVLLIITPLTPQYRTVELLSLPMLLHMHTFPACNTEMFMKLYVFSLLCNVMKLLSLAGNNVFIIGPLCCSPSTSNYHDIFL